MKATFGSGSYSRGLSRLRDTKFVNLTTSEGLPSPLVRPIFEASDGRVWIGTQHGGIGISDGKVIVDRLTVDDGLSSDGIRAIGETPDGAMWVGTESGLNRIDPDGSIEVLLPGEFIQVVYVDDRGELWLSSAGRGVLRRDGDTFRRITSNDGLADNIVRSILRARDGRVWFATNGGLSYLDDAGTVHSLTTDDGLSWNFIYSLYEDPDGVLWIGTYGGGINRYENGTFTSFKKQDGLFDDVAFQILRDDVGNFWITCNRGVFRVPAWQFDAYANGELPALESTAYGHNDGMVNSECNGTAFPAGMKSRDGRIWVPTVEGVSVVDPMELQSNPIPPPVVIHAAQVDREPVDLPLDSDQAIEIAPGRSEPRDLLHGTQLHGARPRALQVHARRF